MFKYYLLLQSCVLLLPVVIKGKGGKLCGAHCADNDLHFLCLIQYWLAGTISFPNLRMSYIYDLFAFKMIFEAEQYEKRIQDRQNLMSWKMNCPMGPPVLYS